MSEKISNEWLRKELRAGRLTHDGKRQASRRWAASDNRADLAAERERELVAALARARDALYEAGQPDSRLDKASAIAVADICAARIANRSG